MVSMVIVVVFYILLSYHFLSSTAQTWIRAGYYGCSDQQFTISDINPALYTHVICASAGVNSTTFQLSLSASDERNFHAFADVAKQKKPPVTAILSIGGKEMNNSIFSSMVSSPSYRKSFVDSSIRAARRLGFQGLDFSWMFPNTKSDMFNMGVLLEEWRTAIRSEARNSSLSQLILIARVNYMPTFSLVRYPVDSIQKYLDWVYIVDTQHIQPDSANSTAANSALYNPSNDNNEDYGIREWISQGLSAKKMAFCLIFYGYAWTLAKPTENYIGAPAKGPAINTANGYLTYEEIKSHIQQYGPNVQVQYNATYAINYWTKGTTWIGFNDVEAVRAKVSYAKEKRLAGYHVWQVNYDDNWTLSKAAAGLDTNNSSVQEDTKNRQNNKRALLEIVFSAAAAIVLLLGIYLIFHCRRRKLRLKGTVDSANQFNDKVKKAAAAGDFNSNCPNLIVFTLPEIEAATDRFSFENKLGQGGYGPVYKGILPNGQKIAVKKLAKTSTQGFEEFKNEVMLTAKLQHVNLVQVLGICIDREEQMLIYEYMPNKSLDTYLFDPIRRFCLDWEKRVHIIEGITQGLLYLQEYSRLTIIHRDLKASNVLLDENMKPKISDFGMARIFLKDDLEANSERIVGTIGYIPPEYVRKGIYSTKSDVYSFGVLLLQIISGKRISILYGMDESLSLLDHAYELWKDGKGNEFMDESLDDTHSSCKLMRCLQIALLCVQGSSNDRPSMVEVFSMLKHETAVMMIPKKPAFSKQYDAQGQHNSTQQLEIYPESSTSDVTISEVAYELWKDGKGGEFMDESLNDTYSSCKLMRCLEVTMLYI